jgi:hypothetical protein
MVERSRRTGLRLQGSRCQINRRAPADLAGARGIVVEPVEALFPDSHFDRCILREVQRVVSEFTRLKVKRATVMNRVLASGQIREHQKITISDGRTGPACFAKNEGSRRSKFELRS